MNQADGMRLKPGYVVQIDPQHDSMFGAAFLIVTEVKSWGVQGYVPMGVFMRDHQSREEHPQRVPTEPTSPGASAAFYRVRFEFIESIGEAAWILDRGQDTEDEGGRS